MLCRSATGYIETQDMAKVGVIVGLIGLLLSIGMMFIVRQLGII